MLKHMKNIINKEKIVALKENFLLFYAFLLPLIPPSLPHFPKKKLKSLKLTWERFCCCCRWEDLLEKENLKGFLKKRTFFNLRVF